MFGKLKNIRLLPIVIFVAALMVSVRVGDIWSVVNEQSDSIEISVNESIAADDVGMSEEVTEKEGDENLTDAEMDNVDFSKGDVTRDSNRVMAAGGGYSQAELSILQDLANRREEIDIREERLSKKVVQLKAAEKQLEQKIIKLKEYEERIKKLLGQYEEKQAKKMASLVKLYSTMKPKDAARIFNDLDLDLLIDMFENMKSTTAAAVLSKMNSDKAQILTAELANRKSLSR